MYKRVLLKVSGELFGASDGSFDYGRIVGIAKKFMNLKVRMIWNFL